MRAMIMTLRSGLCVLLALLAATATAAGAPERPRLPAGMAKYVMVLWEPGTRKPNGETGRRGEEPDLAQHGGTVEASWASHRIVVVPLAAARQLRAIRDRVNLAFGTVQATVDLFFRRAIAKSHREDS